MSKENFNPNDVVSRALLLMKYNTKNTLTENIESVNGLLNEKDYDNTQIGFNKNNFDPIDGTPKNASPSIINQISNNNMANANSGGSGGTTTKPKKPKTPKTPKVKSSPIETEKIAQEVDPLALAQQQSQKQAQDINITQTQNNGGGGPQAPVTPGGKSAQAIKLIDSWKSFGGFMLSPVGVGIIGALGYWIYTVTRNAGNEQKLRDSSKACKVVINKGQRAALQKDGALKDSERNTAAKLFFQGVKNKGGFGGYFGQGWGTNMDSINKAIKLIKNGNIADLCIVMARYETLTDGTDFANDMAGDLDEGDLSEITSTIQDMIDPFAGGGVKIQPEDSYNIAYYKENYPCVFQTKDTFVEGPKLDPDGYTYIVIKGAPRKKSSSGQPYNRKYRLYADGDRIDLADPTNPKPTNATFTCDGTKPTAVLSEGKESLYETYLRKTRVNEVFDDRGIKVVNVATTQEDLEGWDEGKKVAEWPIWLQKYPCLKQKFPTGKALTDNMSYTYFINLNPKNNKNYRFYSDGEIWDAEGTKFIGKKWSCSLRGDTVLVESRKNIMEQIPFDIEGETDITPVVDPNVDPNKKPVVDPNKVTMKPCLDFPITQGCYGRVIGEIQSALGIHIDAKFGPDTFKALVKYGAPNGVLTKEIYDKIMAEFKAKQSGGNSGGNSGGSGSNTGGSANPDDLLAANDPNDPSLGTN